MIQNTHSNSFCRITFYAVHTDSVYVKIIYLRYFFYCQEWSQNPRKPTWQWEETGTQSHVSLGIVTTLSQRTKLAALKTLHWRQPVIKARKASQVLIWQQHQRGYVLLSHSIGYLNTIPLMTCFLHEISPMSSSWGKFLQYSVSIYTKSVNRCVV